MQITCQKIVRVQNGLITEIYDGLKHRHFHDNDAALKELLMEDVGLDFKSVIQTYEQLIMDLAHSFPDLRDFLSERLPDDWLEWIQPQIPAEVKTVIAAAPSRL